MRRGLKEGDCDNIGVAMCAVCHRPCCLQHAHIDQYADAICYLCVSDAMQLVPEVQRQRARQEREAGGTPPPRGNRQAPPPPPGGAPPPHTKPGPSPEAVAAALSALGLRRGAKWDAIKVAHRKLSAANHPDRAKGARAKAAAEARFVEVQKAFDLLKRVYPEAA